MSWPARVEIREVGPRDGLQNEDPVPVADRVRLIDALSGTGLSGADMGQILSVIDGYTRGASDTAISLARSRARGVSDAEWAAAVGADLGRAIGDARFPRFAALLTSPGGPSRTMRESFDFGLQRVLDGIALYIESQGADARA